MYLVLRRCRHAQHRGSGTRNHSAVRVLTSAFVAVCVFTLRRQGSKDFCGLSFVPRRCPPASRASRSLGDAATLALLQFRVLHLLLPMDRPGPESDETIAEGLEKK